MVGSGGDPFLHDGDFFDGGFDPEITSGHHDPIGGFEDFVYFIVDGSPLNLGDDEWLVPHGLRCVPDGQDVAGVIDEGLADGIDSMGKGKFHAYPVMGGKGRDSQIDAGQVEPFF